MKKRIKTIGVELLSDERDFIVVLIHYALSNELVEKLRLAKPRKNQYLTIPMTLCDLEDLIRNLSLEANHNDIASTQDDACKIAEIIKMFEWRLKDTKSHRAREVSKPC